jgi:hypothetical protein
VTAETTVREHQWVELKVTPVEVIDGVAVSSGKESQVTIGCFRCNMGLDEGKDISCPEQDLFEEESEEI